MDELETNADWKQAVYAALAVPLPTLPPPLPYDDADVRRGERRAEAEKRWRGSNPQSGHDAAWTLRDVEDRMEAIRSVICDLDDQSTELGELPQGDLAFFDALVLEYDELANRAALLRRRR